jgi:hypothetical protein
VSNIHRLCRAGRNHREKGRVRRQQGPRRFYPLYLRIPALQLTIRPPVIHSCEHERWPEYKVMHVEDLEIMPAATPPAAPYGKSRAQTQMCDIAFSRRYFSGLVFRSSSVQILCSFAQRVFVPLSMVPGLSAGCNGQTGSQLSCYEDDFFFWIDAVQSISIP